MDKVALEEVLTSLSTSIFFSCELLFRASHMLMNLSPMGSTVGPLIRGRTPSHKFDVHEFVHRDTTMKITNKLHCID